MCNMYSTCENDRPQHAQHVLQVVHAILVDDVLLNAATNAEQVLLQNITITK